MPESHAGGTDCDTKSEFSTTMLGTKPECTDYSQQDIHQQKAHHPKPRLHLIDIGTIIILTYHLVIVYLQYKKISHTELGIRLFHQTLRKAGSRIRLYTQANFRIERIQVIINLGQLCFRKRNSHIAIAVIWPKIIVTYLSRYGSYFINVCRIIHIHDFFSQQRTVTLITVKPYILAENRISVFYSLH